MDTHSSYRLPSLVPFIVLGNAFCFLRRYGLALIAAAAFLMWIPIAAEAGSNIKQKDTGATVWENQDGDQYPAGDSGLTVLLEDLSTASTAYVVSHKSGNIVKIWSVLLGAITTADAVLEFHVVDPQSGTVAVSENGTLTISAGSGSGAVTGDIDSVDYSSDPLASTAVTQGDAIAVTTNGGSTRDFDAVITIIIE